MAKITKPAKRKPKSQAKPRPAPATETTAAAIQAISPRDQKRLNYERKAVLANQALTADNAKWRTVNQVRETLAEEDRRRFADLASIPLPSKLATVLSDRQRLFCYEVFRDGQQQHAYVRAGFSPNRSAQAANVLMRHSGVREAIDWLADAATAQDESSAEWIVRQLRQVYETCRGIVQVLDRNGKPTGDYRIDAAGALRALELIGKARGIFTQTIKHEHSGSVTHLLQAIAGTGKPALEDRAAIDVTPSTEQVGVDVGVDSDES